MGAEADAAALRASSPWPGAEDAGPAAQDAGPAAQDAGPAAQDAGPAAQDALGRRPDVRAAAARFEAADRARALARSLRTRDVTVSAQFEHYPISEANSAGSGNSFGVGVALPLFLRHSYEGEAARAQADWYAARDAYDRTVALAKAEIARARADVAAARERRARIERDLLPQANRSAEAAEFAFRNGAIGALDLLDARRTLRAIQIEASAARAEHARALAALRAGVEELPADALAIAEGDSRKEQ
jgi:cobalt-zinc-cadmium efflux system outer membrane protein